MNGAVLLVIFISSCFYLWRKRPEAQVIVSGFIKKTAEASYCFLLLTVDNQYVNCYEEYLLTVKSEGHLTLSYIYTGHISAKRISSGSSSAI